MILANAIQLFASRGYDAVGIQELAVRSGITKPTLYYYFGSKKGLLEAILTQYGARLFQVLREATVFQGDLSASLEAIAAGYFQFAQANPMFYRMQLAMYFAPPDSEPNQMIRPLNEIQHRLIEDLFRRAVENSPGLQGDPQGNAAILMGTINTYIGFALNGYLELNQALVHRVADQFLHGIWRS
ncbi:MAG TPA: TetR/AcrR family transcriptional regulator [Bacillota bacterium]|nr:TetR/AcrR family transcriptional regulator [Bacillota bacterium]